MAALPVPEQSIADALDRLWVQFLPQMQERVAVMEAANHALADGSLTIDQRGAASAAAHKLAGSLGTFGLTKGTVLAREAEMLFSSESEMNEATLPRLQEIAGQIRAIIDHRK